MSTINHPFGKPEEARKVEDNKTPAQEKEEAKTGRPVGAPVGDSADTKTETTKEAPASRTTAPSGKNKEVWAQAEANVLGSGGFAGLDNNARTKLVQERYDQMVENDKQTKKWAGDSNLLGDK